MTQNPLLNIHDLTISLPKGAQRATAVELVTFNLYPNEILCVVGESGSGKSMLGKAIMGLLPGSGIAVSNGQIIFEGEDLSQASNERLRTVRGRQISMIFQEPMTALNPLMTVGNQIAEVLEAHQIGTRAEQYSKVLEILRDVHLPNPETIYSAYPHQLSGGQRQRAVIAMALILEPQIIIADEPTTALDVTTQAQILHLIKEIQRKRNTGVLFITHDFGVVAEIADRVAVMQNGKLVEVGSRDEVLNHPEHNYTKSLIAAVPRLSVDPLNVSKASNVAITVKNLSKTYRSGGGFLGGPLREVKAVKNVSFTLKKGQTLGIVGESGSGKSTLARLIIRLIEADEGEIIIENTDIRALSTTELRSYRPNIQMIFQDPYASLNPRHKVGRIISEAMMLYGAKPQEMKSRRAELLELVGLDSSTIERYPHEFSGGQRQRIGIARALAMRPNILIADEAVSALDVSIQKQVLELLDRLQQELGFTMLFITHDLCVAAKVSDQIAVMQNGQIVELASAFEVLVHPQVIYTQELLKAQPGQDWLQ